MRKLLLLLLALILFEGVAQTHDPTKTTWKNIETLSILRSNFELLPHKLMSEFHSIDNEITKKRRMQFYLDEYPKLKAKHLSYSFIKNSDKKEFELLFTRLDSIIHVTLNYFEAMSYGFELHLDVVTPGDSLALVIEKQEHVWGSYFSGTISMIDLALKLETKKSQFLSASLKQNIEHFLAYNHLRNLIDEIRDEGNLVFYNYTRTPENFASLLKNIERLKDVANSTPLHGLAKIKLGAYQTFLHDLMQVYSHEQAFYGSLPTMKYAQKIEHSFKSSAMIYPKLNGEGELDFSGVWHFLEDLHTLHQEIETELGFYVYHPEATLWEIKDRDF